MNAASTSVTKQSFLVKRSWVDINEGNLAPSGRVPLKLALESYVSKRRDRRAALEV